MVISRFYKFISANRTDMNPAIPTIQLFKPQIIFDQTHKSILYIHLIKET